VSAPSKNDKADKKKSGANDFRLPADSSWGGAWKIAAGVGVLGLAGAAGGWATAPDRFPFSYLFAFFLVLTVAFGSMFFVLVERLTAASWSVTVRRTAEFFIAPAGIFLILFVPILMTSNSLFPWMHGSAEPGIVEQTAHAQEEHPAQAEHGPSGAEHAGPGTGHGAGAHAGPGAEHARGHEAAEAEDDGPEEAADAKTLAWKSGWLNKPAWIGRALFYFIVWAWIGMTFFGLSTRQDASKDPKLTVRAQKLAPVATILFGLTLTGAAFDWLMSMLPTWYSTIFGVTIFAGSVVVMYATLIVVTMALRQAGHLKDAVNVEHFHDLGKLMFGFLVFWAYTSFAQFMLIWYAAIPEETQFFHHRWDVGPWAAVSLAIVVLHFVVPFFLVLSRNVKRRPWALRIGALWLIVMHAVEMYWFVFPYYGHGEVTVSWIDLACLLGVAGVYLAAVFHRMTKHPLIPIGDPRLSRSLSFENA
jgi:hypothetical protein